MEKYYVSDADGGKEISVPKREDPFASILGRPEAKKTEEKVLNESFAAGDAIVRETKNALAGREEAVVEQPKDIIYGHCNNCRLELTEDRVVKQEIDWVRNEDGTLSKMCSRFSVFCKNCMKFICVLDQQAAKMLNDMIHKNK